MMIPTHEELIAAIDAFFARHPEIGEATFGRRATGEPGLLQRLRAGSSPTLRLMTKISDYIAAVDAQHGDADTATTESTSAGKTEISSRIAA